MEVNDGRMLSSKNQQGLTPHQIKRCKVIWEYLNGDQCCRLVTTEATQPGSSTRFNQIQNVVYLGADVQPGVGLSARSRLTELACLAHELAHAERFRKGYDRSMEMQSILRDEAEASLDASFTPGILSIDRHDLVEDAYDQLREWLTQDYKEKHDED